jgi:carboxypeptidase T
MKTPIALFLCHFSLCTLFAQVDVERFSEVAISTDDYLLLVADESHGLAMDHFHKNENGDLEFIFSESELLKLSHRNINYDLMIEDVTSHFLRINQEQAGTRQVACGLTNFDEGDMGGYHTYQQIIEHANHMQTLYPDIVQVAEIGQSLENRPIMAIKISDNVTQDESATEGVVYFDALTHAREPMSLEVMLYYMWWLLENHENNEEANYLVSHRESYFVPVVNPDGYVYNQQTNPNGGGFWRKNRRDAGNGCFGVDLNRNFSKGWGLDSGSSDDPCTEIYRGEAPFSEPEAEAVAQFLGGIQPAIAFTLHTYGDKFLSPWGYVDSLASYETYAEFSSEFIPATYAGYGTTSKMLNYTSSGTTRDYMHSTGIYGWTPEIGHSFWEPASVICERVEEFFIPMKYLHWVSGAYSCFHDFTLSNENVWTGETIAMDIRIKNRGLTKIAEGVSVNVSTSHPAIVAINSEVSYGNIDARAFAESLDAPFRFEVTGQLNIGERIPFTVNVYQQDDLSYSKVIYITAGVQTILSQTDFETDNPWLLPALEWDTTFMDAVSGSHSFADSRYGNYVSESNTMVVMDQPVDLTNTTHPVLHFNTKWALEPYVDNVTFLVSTNGGSNWLPAPGLHSDAFGNYTGNQHWVPEHIDLSDYIGEPQLYFAFELISDNSVHSDGIYIDDFVVSDYTEPVMIGTNHINATLESWRILPNPNRGDFQVQLQVSAALSAKLLLYDLSGKLLLEKEVELLAGKNNVAYSVPNWSAGIYSLQLRTVEGGVPRQLKVVVLPE